MKNEYQSKPPATLYKDEFKAITNDIVRLNREHQLCVNATKETFLLCDYMAAKSCIIMWQLLREKTESSRTHLKKCIAVIQKKRKYDGRSHALNTNAVRLYEGQIPIIFQGIETYYRKIPEQFIIQTYPHVLTNFTLEICRLVRGLNNTTSFQLPDLG